MITRGLTTETNLAVPLVSFLDNPRNHPLDCFVLLIEEISQHTRVTVNAQYKLSQIIRSDREAIKVVGETGGQNDVRWNLTHDVDLETIPTTPEAILGHDVQHLAGLFDSSTEGDHDNGILEAHLLTDSPDSTAF
ncbi:hypothetical protein HG530_011885 [Fusarium avenaceum]|nr:hypothetical protein HG530_011885 [Fusarium avenaceum]